MWSYHSLVPEAVEELFGKFRELMQREIALNPELAEEAAKLRLGMP